MSLSYLFMLAVVSLIIVVICGGLTSESISEFVIFVLVTGVCVDLFRRVTGFNIPNVVTMLDGSTENTVGCCGLIVICLILANLEGGGGGPRLQYHVGKGLETVYDIGFGKNK
jgi:hypothetical protein